jgi:hypothetical protein
MKFFTSILVLFCMTINAFADCDWSQIKKNPDNTFTYSEPLHLCVGKLVQDNKVKTQQIADLTKALTMKDLSIKASDDRANLWMSTSEKLEDRVNKLDSMEKKNEWLYFGLGALTVLGAGYTAAKLIGH